MSYYDMWFVSLGCNAILIILYLLEMYCLKKEKETSTTWKELFEEEKSNCREVDKLRGDHAGKLYRLNNTYNELMKTVVKRRYGHYNLCKKDGQVYFYWNKKGKK